MGVPRAHPDAGDPEVGPPLLVYVYIILACVSRERNDVVVGVGDKKAILTSRSSISTCSANHIIIIFKAKKQNGGG